MLPKLINMFRRIHRFFTAAIRSKPSRDLNKKPSQHLNKKPSQHLKNRPSRYPKKRPCRHLKAVVLEPPQDLRNAKIDIFTDTTIVLEPPQDLRNAKIDIFTDTTIKYVKFVAATGRSVPKKSSNLLVRNATMARVRKADSENWKRVIRDVFGNHK
jgi:hypothetical protein